MTNSDPRRNPTIDAPHPIQYALAGNDKATLKPSGREVAALNTLLGDLNNPAITGASIPPGEKERVLARQNRDGLDATDIPSLIPTQEVRQSVPPVAEPKSETATSQRDMSRIFFTGKLLSGKDWLASHLGAHIFGFADPLYAVQAYYFPGSDKKSPGARALLQTIGQWGRGIVNEKYPLTPGRALFSEQIREWVRMPDLMVDWSAFGIDSDIWLNSLVARVNAFRYDNPGVLVAATNVRFENEFHRLTNEGWTHFHVITSPATWAKRLAAVGLRPDSLEARDLSESLARALDADVTKRVSRGQGRKLRVVWSDPDSPCPTSRFYSVDEFLRLVPSSQRPVAAPEPELPVNLGDVSMED